MKSFFFLHFFAIPSSSRHEKRCRISKRNFGYFNALETRGALVVMLRTVQPNKKGSKCIPLTHLLTDEKYKSFNISPQPINYKKLTCGTWSFEGSLFVEVIDILFVLEVVVVCQYFTMSFNWSSASFITWITALSFSFSCSGSW